MALINRMEGDQVKINKEMYKDYELRPFNVVTKFILAKIGHHGSLCSNGTSNGVLQSNGMTNGTTNGILQSNGISQ